MSAEPDDRFPIPTPLSVHADRRVDIFGDSVIGSLWAAAWQPAASTEAVASLARKIQASLDECGDAVLVLLRSATGAVDVAVDALTVGVMRQDPAPEAPHETAQNHTRLARELRDLTGLSAAALGAALGVTREQYQRWISGGAISDARHGQLIYLHTIAADVLRRLGPTAAKLWWRTPTPCGSTPGELLTRREADRVYRLAAEIPDPAPVVNGVIVGLSVQRDLEATDFEVSLEDDGEAWSPYGDARPES